MDGWGPKGENTYGTPMLKSHSFILLLIEHDRYIYGKLPINKQSVAFSATFTDELLDSLNDFVKDPHIVKLTYDLPTLEGKNLYTHVII